MEHIYIEKHGAEQLIKLKRNGRIVAGIMASGEVVTMAGATDGLTDDEWLELLSIPSGDEESV